MAKGRVALLTAWLRSPAQFETTFAMESFIDELAAAAGQDPLAFRLAHLRDPRAIAVLKAAAEAYGWESRPAGVQGSNRAASQPGPRHRLGQSRRRARRDHRGCHGRPRQRPDQGRARRGGA